ncbi:MAG: cytochrome c [Acidimicrobiia bacterium]|jgi:mono/diheme cytochrome c family protein
MPSRVTRRFRALAAIGALVATSGIAVAACGGGGSEASRPTTGPEIYKAYCLTCHGAQGQGFVGPQLAGVMEAKYPDIDDQIALVANGKGTMPGWGDRLTAAEIRKVVEFERTKLGR